MTIQVDGYDDITEMARGGFGVVYRAHQAQFDRTVALKVLSLLELDERSRSRFERECKAMGAVSWHPHIVDVHESGTTAGGYPFLSMEFLPNGSLGDRMAALNGPLPWQEAVVLVIQVAGALQCAHDAGLLHRDLKPENILLGLYGDAHLTDFGIATVEGHQHTTTGMAAFTISHAAPEILQGERATSASDVYSLGSTLFHLLYGRPPFATSADDNVFDAINRAIQESPPDLRLSGIPPALADRVEWAMHKNPTLRPGTAADFGRALQDVQRELGVPVTEMRLDPRTQAQAPVPSDETVEVATPPPPPVVESDATVLTATPTPPTPPPPPPPPDPPRPEPQSEKPKPEPKDAKPGRLKGWLLIGGALLVAVALVVGLVVVIGGGDDGGEDDPTADLQAVGDVVTTIDVGTSPRGVAIGEGAIWVANRGDGTVSRIDQETNEVTDTIDVGEGPREVAVDFGAVWVTVQEAGLVVKIDAASGEVVDQIDLGGQPHGIATGDGLVWVTQRQAGTLLGINPDNLGTEVLVAVEGAPEAVAEADGTAWVVGVDSQVLSQVDIAAQAVTTTFDLPKDPAGVAVDGTTVWVVSQGEAELIRLDATTSETVARIELGGDPEYLALEPDGTVWVDGEDELLEVDPATNQAVGTVQVGSQPRAIAIDGDTLAVANFGDDTVSRVAIDG